MKVRNSLRGMAESRGQGACHSIVDALWLEKRITVNLLSVYVVCGHDPASSAQVVAMQRCVKRAERALACCMGNWRAGSQRSEFAMVLWAISRVPQAAPMLHLGSFDHATQGQTKATVRGLWGAGVVQVVLLSWTCWSEQWMEFAGNLVLWLPGWCAGGMN